MIVPAGFQLMGQERGRVGLAEIMLRQELEEDRMECGQPIHGIIRLRHREDALARHIAGVAEGHALGAPFAQARREMSHRAADPASSHGEAGPVIGGAQPARALARRGKRAGAARIGRQLVEGGGMERIGQRELRRERAVMDVADQRLAMLVGEGEGGDEPHGIAGEGEAAFLVEGVAHQRIAPGLDALGHVDVIGMAIGPAQDRRQTEVDIAGYGATGLAPRRIAFDRRFQHRHDPAFSIPGLSRSACRTQRRWVILERASQRRVTGIIFGLPVVPVVR